MKILLAVDGSKNSLDAVNCVVEHVRALRESAAVELVTVHLPVPRLPRLSVAVGKRQIERYYREEGEAMLAKAKKRLDAARVRYTAHILVGPIAETIVRHARDTRCGLICIGTRGRSAVGNLLMGSVATKVLHLAGIPVLLVK